MRVSKVMSNDFLDASVIREVRSVMGASLPREPQTRSLISIPRKVKRKSNVAFEKYGGASSKKPKATFQKKLVVFNYMGETPPTRFTRKDKYIVMRGLLPETEDLARKEIRDVLRCVILLRETGCVYIRMVKDLFVAVISSDSDEPVLKSEPSPEPEPALAIINSASVTRRKYNYQIPHFKSKKT